MEKRILSVLVVHQVGLLLLPEQRSVAWVVLFSAVFVRDCLLTLFVCHFVRKSINTIALNRYISSRNFQCILSKGKSSSKMAIWVARLML